MKLKEGQELPPEGSVKLLAGFDPGNDDSTVFVLVDHTGAILHVVDPAELRDWAEVKMSQEMKYYIMGKHDEEINRAIKSRLEVKMCLPWEDPELVLDKPVFSYIGPEHDGLSKKELDQALRLNRGDRIRIGSIGLTVDSVHPYKCACGHLGVNIVIKERYE